MKYLITVDWLELMLSGRIHSVEKDFTNGKIQDSYPIHRNLTLLKNTEQTHPGFHQCFHVIFQSKNFGNLFYQPTGKYRFKHKNAIQFRMSNEFFYQKNYSDELKQLITDLGLIFTHYYRMDIAVDGSGILQRANELLKRKSFQQVRNVKIKTEFNNQSKLFDNIIFGSRYSHKHISVYNKSAEINCGKQYILDYWQMNNLIMNGSQIDRAELRMNSQMLRNFTHDFSELENADYLSSYFKTTSEKYLEFYHKKKPKKRETIINWSRFRNITVNKLEKINSHGNLQCIKTSLKCLIMEYYCGCNNQLLEAITIIANEYNLNDWVAESISSSRWKSQIKLKLLPLIREAKERV